MLVLLVLLIMFQIEKTIAVSEKIQKENDIIIHSKNAILMSGEFKGYCCFVTDVFPACMEIELVDSGYLFCDKNAMKKVGEVIKTASGDCKIMDIIPEMYEIVEIGSKKSIRLPCDAYFVIFFLKNGNVLKKSGDEFYLVKNHQVDVNELNDEYFNQIMECESEKIVFDENAESSKILSVYCKVIDKKYKEFYNNIGFLVRKIDQQYLLGNKFNVVLRKNQLKHLKDHYYLIKNGTHKNKVGSCLNVYETSFVVTINANGKKISDIYVKNESVYEKRKIVKSDMFYVDAVLKSGNYFQVKEKISQNEYLGLEHTKDYKFVERKVFIDEMEEIDFQVTKQKETSIIMKMEEKNVLDKDICYENEKEKNNDTEDNDEMEVENYGDEDENENIENSVEFETMGTENEMKSTFKDSGRLNVMEKKLSDEENDIKKLIEKCEKIIGYNTENNFKIIEKAIDSVKIFCVGRKTINQNISINTVCINLPCCLIREYALTSAIVDLYICRIGK